MAACYGRQVQLEFLSDASSTTQVVTNYQKFITVDNVDLVLGPYSTLLTKPASVVANRYGYAFMEGSGGGPSVFTQRIAQSFRCFSANHLPDEQLCAVYSVVATFGAAHNGGVCNRG